MSRKMRKAMGRDCGRRRSPRISALDAWKQNHHQETRTIKRRKFDSAAAFSKLGKQVWKGRDSPQNDDHSTDYVEWRCGRASKMVKENQKHDHHAITNGKPSIMPAKHILELVLDTLQRRDTYEIFAEPVDPDEVEDYYEIIKEAMDFGTMRAKLHEGMYKNLEEFEHDVFLIPENAMHFNSSATIYFRQARAIHELAKRVFDALKMDPEKFVLEYSGTRRKSMRKALSETKDSRFCINAKSGGGDVSSSNGTLHSPSTFRRTRKKNPDASTRISHHFFTGNRDGRSSSFQVADRRSTYWTCNHKDSIGPVQMIEGDISYRDSLMSFVKDLGPIAQMVAKRKLLGQCETNLKCHELTQRKSDDVSNSNSSKVAAAFRTFRDFASGPHPFLKMSNNIIDLTEDGEEAHNNNNGRGKEKTDEKEKIKSSRGSTVAVTLAKKQGGVSRKISEMRRKRSKCDSTIRPVILALENSHPTNDFPDQYNKSRNKRSCHTIPEAEAEAEAEADERKKEMPLVVSQFTFDLPFLKARLNQMNLPISKSPFAQIEAAASGTGGSELNNQKAAEALSCTPPINPFLYNQSLDTNLALGL